MIVDVTGIAAHQSEYSIVAQRGCRLLTSFHELLERTDAGRQRGQLLLAAFELGRALAVRTPRRLQLRRRQGREREGGGCDQPPCRGLTKPLLRLLMSDNCVTDARGVRDFELAMPMRGRKLHHPPPQADLRVQNPPARI